MKKFSEMTKKEQDIFSTCLKNALAEHDKNKQKKFKSTNAFDHNDHADDAKILKEFFEIDDKLAAAQAKNKNKDLRKPSEIESESMYYASEEQYHPDHFTFLKKDGVIYKLDNYTHTFQSTFSII